ncbi:agmatinase [Pectinatus cerevisiiphilus]|uniref:Agmatinase n=1 Tax=Pectinatus cerevisiiphilus TaxID=86956 RepID=A0A4R3K1N1_9FIRM|nr:agmatinase [Pectinatus cerevisiiphilus]TCS75619.1 agmatinase [Pectinatus cerevisiiphilus]
MKLNKNIETILGCEKEYTDADIVIFGAPFDSTASYRPGTRFASKTMRSESYNMETYSPYLELDLEEDTAVFDAGELDLSLGNTPKTLETIYDFSKKLLEDKKLPFMIGGEHLVTYGSVKAVAEKYPDLHIIHFDAHADLRDEFLGTPFSHATVLHRCHDLLGDGRIFQFAIRSGEKAELNWGKKHVFTHMFDFANLDKIIKELENKPIYFTVDLDVLDPAVFPGTGTPEAGGVSFNELRLAMQAVAKLNIVGTDMVELSPPCDLSGMSTTVALKLLREYLLALSHKNKK